MLFESFPKATDDLFVSFELGTLALIMPFKLLLFTIHNYLTKRDYTYSIDDIGDIAVAICVGVWIYTFQAWSAIEPQPDEKAYIENYKQ